MLEETTEDLLAWASDLRAKTRNSLYATCPNTSKPTAVQYIYALANSFPCLESKILRCEPKKFDADEFYAATLRWSHGERLCALFVLNVWNPAYAKSKGWNFDLFEFAGICDRQNSLIIRQWLQDPYWP